MGGGGGGAMDASGLTFTRSLVRDMVLVKPQFLGANYRDVILEQLRSKHEGGCSRHGYILAGSIAMHRVSLGHVEAATLNGDVRYEVQYYASICNPAVGCRMAARVINMNKFGLLAHSGVQAPDGTFVPVVETIVTRNVTGIASEVDLDAIKLGDTIFVEILGKKFELRDRKISVIGRAVRRLEQPAEGEPLLPAALDPLGVDATRRRERRERAATRGEADAASESGGSEGGGELDGGDEEQSDEEEAKSESDSGSSISSDGSGGDDSAEEELSVAAEVEEGEEGIEGSDVEASESGGSDDAASENGSDASGPGYGAGSVQSGGGGFDCDGDLY